MSTFYQFLCKFREMSRVYCFLSKSLKRSRFCWFLCKSLEMSRFHPLVTTRSHCNFLSIHSILHFKTPICRKLLCLWQTEKTSECWAIASELNANVENLLIHEMLDMIGWLIKMRKSFRTCSHNLITKSLEYEVHFESLWSLTRRWKPLLEADQFCFFMILENVSGLHPSFSVIERLQSQNTWIRFA